MLQSQLENATKIMLNLSATVAQLQREVYKPYIIPSPSNESYHGPPSNVDQYLKPVVHCVLQVSDRQSYLVLSLILCLTLGLLLCTQCCRSSPNHNTSSAIPMSNHYPSPKRYNTHQMCLNAIHNAMQEHNAFSVLLQGVL